MYEHILRDGKHLYRLFLDENEQLLKLSQAEQGKITSACNLSEMPVDCFSADINSDGLHMLAHTARKLLVYINYLPDGRLNSANLARISAEEQNISHPVICADKNGLRIYYVVSEPGSYSLVEYKKDSSSWKGRRLYNSPDALAVLANDKRTGKVYFMQEGSPCALFECVPSVKRLLEAPSFNFMQFLNGQPLYESEGKIYLNGEYLFDGECPCLYCSGGENYTLYCLSDGQPCRSDYNSGFAPPAPRNNINQWKIYKYTDSSQNCFLLSTPFPRISLPLAESAPQGVQPQNAELLGRLRQLEEEVYLLKRATFNLEAEVRALKNAPKRPQ